MPSTVLAQTAVLSVLRFLLYLTCQKYVLRSLYSDLKTLSSGPDSNPVTPALPTDSAIELDALPPPATQPKSQHSRPIINNKPLLQSTISRNVFSITFTESCMMFVLLMLQATDTLSPRARLFNWKLSLVILMCTILLVAPLSFSLLFAVGSNSTSKSLPRISQLLLHLLLTLLYLFLFSHIPLPPALQSPDTNAMTAALTRLIVVGTIILGLLSGFGAISNSWAFIPMFSRTSEGEITDRDISTTEFALRSVRNDLRERTAEVERRACEPADGNWLIRTFRGGDGHQQELQGLQALEYQMSRKLENLRVRRETVLYSRTFRGRVLNFGGRVFAMYCVFRIVCSMINILLPSPNSGHDPQKTTTYPDLITDLLAYALSFITPVPVEVEDVASFARQISLVLVGLIICTSLRLVLRSVTRALRITNRTLGASLMTLLLAQLMGIYLLSTIVQLRASFPPPPTPPNSADSEVEALTTNLFSTIPAFEVFGSLFDWSFLLAAGGTTFGRWSRERISGVE